MKCICTTPNVVAEDGDEVEPRSATSVGNCEVDSLTYRDDLTNVDSVQKQLFSEHFSLIFLCCFFKFNKPSHIAPPGT